MTALSTSTPDLDASVPAGTRLLTVTGVALVLSGLAQLADELFAGPQVEVVDTLAFRLGTATHLVAFLLLVLAASVVSARRWTGHGSGGRAVDALFAIGAVLAACAMWEIAFVSPVLVDVAPQLVNAEPGALGVGLGISLIAFTVALVALGVGMLRAGTASRRTAGIVLGAGLLFVVLPAAQLLLGLGLLSGRREG